MTKTKITNAALAGLPLDGRDVARVERGGDVYLRHSWRRAAEGAVYRAVDRAAVELCRTLARRSGRPVCLYTHDGIRLEQVQP